MLAFLGLALTPIALIVSGLIILILCEMFAQEKSSSRSDTICLWATMGILVLLFVINYFVGRQKEPEKYYHDDPDLSVVGQAVSRQKAKISVLLWILFTGPRLVNWWIFSFREIGRLRRLDIHSGAAMLWVLLYKGKRLSYPDIQKEMDWLNVEATAPLLSWLPGMLYINSDPPALSLTEDLRKAIRSGETP